MSVTLYQLHRCAYVHAIKHTAPTKRPQFWAHIGRYAGGHWHTCACKPMWELMIAYITITHAELTVKLRSPAHTHTHSKSLALGHRIQQRICLTDANRQDSWRFSSCRSRAHVSATRAKRVGQWKENRELITERCAWDILDPLCQPHCHEHSAPL